MASQLVKIKNIKHALRIDLAKKPNNAINCVISGRVRSLRIYKSHNFVDLIDGSSNNHLQVIINKNLLKKPNIGSYITCHGQLVQSRGSQQNVEFKVDEIANIGDCNPETYPLLVNNTESDAWYRKYIHLRPRAQHFAALLRVRSELDLSLHMIMKQMDFFKVQTPVLTSNDSEGNSSLFTVGRQAHFKDAGLKSSETDEEVVSSDDSDGETDPNSSDIELNQVASSTHFFNKEVFLTSSAQLHLECLASSLSRVYSIGPIFRAENSAGSRHLCEFTMLEVEEANVDQVSQLMDRVETIIKFVSQFLSEVSEHKSDFSSLLDKYSHHKIFEKLAHKKYIRMSYTEAISILKSKMLKDGVINFGKDINKTNERMLSSHCDNVPIFIFDYPKELKPFYMKSTSDDKRTVACFDLVAPLGGEICGGSLREDDLQKLKANLTDDHNLDKLDWYIQLREYGSFPHGGFGLGIERLIKSLTGIRNIKDTVPFPRWPGYCKT